MYHPLSLNGYSKIINAVKRQRNLGLQEHKIMALVFQIFFILTGNLEESHVTLFTRKWKSHTTLLFGIAAWPVRVKYIQADVNCKN
jgi:membrane protein CcdC involved in cytochrome C biogenesis